MKRKFKDSSDFENIKQREHKKQLEKKFIEYKEKEAENDMNQVDPRINFGFSIHFREACLKVEKDCEWEAELEVT